MPMPNMTPELIDRLTTVCDKFEQRVDSFLSRHDGGSGSGVQGHRSPSQHAHNHLDKGMKEREAKKPASSFKL